MNFPKELRYTKTHEWVRKEGDRAIVGISEYAQHEISDVVFIELPHVGNNVEQGKSVTIEESVKAAFDIYSPVSGTIKTINTTLESNPALINQDPYGKGWLFELTAIKPEELNSLMTAEQYEHMIHQSAS